jgi:hypothetical protein
VHSACFATSSMSSALVIVVSSSESEWWINQSGKFTQLQAFNSLQMQLSMNFLDLCCCVIVISQQLQCRFQRRIHTLIARQFTIQFLEIVPFVSQYRISCSSVITRVSRVLAHAFPRNCTPSRPVQQHRTHPNFTLWIVHTSHLFSLVHKQ